MKSKEEETAVSLPSTFYLVCFGPGSPRRAGSGKQKLEGK